MDFRKLVQAMSQSLIHQVSVSDVTENRSLSRLIESQSLIHQVSVSDGKSKNGARKWLSLNPLFIRSQFQIIQGGMVFTVAIFVSIPYSSGLSFRCLYFDGVDDAITTSQSLIHQVSVSDLNTIKIINGNIRVSIPYSSGLSFR